MESVGRGEDEKGPANIEISASKSAEKRATGRSFKKCGVPGVAQLGRNRNHSRSWTITGERRAFNQEEKWIKVGGSISKKVHNQRG